MRIKGGRWKGARVRAQGHHHCCRGSERAATPQNPPNLLAQAHGARTFPPPSPPPPLVASTNHPRHRCHRLRAALTPVPKPGKAPTPGVPQWPGGRRPQVLRVFSPLPKSPARLMPPLSLILGSAAPYLAGPQPGGQGVGPGGELGIPEPSGSPLGPAHPFPPTKPVPHPRGSEHSGLLPSHGPPAWARLL